MAKARKTSNVVNFSLMLLFIIAVAVVFSLVFTNLLLPVNLISSNNDVKFVFTILLIFSSTVSSLVAIIIYLILSKKISTLGL